jgi:hypothetical protein
MRYSTKSAPPSDSLERAQEGPEEREPPDPDQQVEYVAHDEPTSLENASDEEEMAALPVRALCRIQAAGVRFV